MSYTSLGSTATTKHDNAVKNAKLFTDMSSFFRSTQVLSVYASAADFMAALILAGDTGQPIDWGKLGTNYLKDFATAATAIAAVCAIVGPVLTPFGIGIPIDAMAAAFGAAALVAKLAAGGSVPTTAQVSAISGPVNDVAPESAKKYTRMLNDPNVQATVISAANTAKAAGKLPSTPVLPKKSVPIRSSSGNLTATSTGVTKISSLQAFFASKTGVVTVGALALFAAFTVAPMITSSFSRKKRR